jgi:hypothetical protein
MWYLFGWFFVCAASGYIAHLKGRSWIPPVLLTLIAPPIGLLAALLPATKRADAAPVPKRISPWFATAPFFLACVVVFANAEPGDYWNVAPWLIIGSIPVCIAVLAVTEVISLLRARGSRNAVEKSASRD